MSICSAGLLDRELVFCPSNSAVGKVALMLFLQIPDACASLVVDIREFFDPSAQRYGPGVEAFLF